MNCLFITGGGGFIGSNFVRELLNKGFKIINLDLITYATSLQTLSELKQKAYSPSSDIKIGDDILVLLENQNKVVRISDSIVYSYEVYCEMVQIIRSHLKSFEEISVAEVRDMFNASRKYALALMEYLDTQQVTKRIGDKRILF